MKKTLAERFRDSDWLSPHEKDMRRSNDLTARQHANKKHFEGVSEF